MLRCTALQHNVLPRQKWDESNGEGGKNKKIANNIQLIPNMTRATKALDLARFAPRSSTQEDIPAPGVNSNQLLTQLKALFTVSIKELAFRVHPPCLTPYSVVA